MENPIERGTPIYGNPQLAFIPLEPHMPLTYLVVFTHALNPDKSRWKGAPIQIETIAGCKRCSSPATFRMCRALNKSI